MIRELENIPAVWTTLFHWFACLLYAGLLPKRRPAWQCAGAAVVLLALMLPCMEYTARQSRMPFWLGTTWFFLLTLLFFFAVCQGGAANHVYYASRALVLGGFAVSLAWQLFVFYRLRHAWLESLLVQAVWMLLQCGAVCGVMYGLERGHQREMREMAISWKSSLSVLLISQIVYRLNGLSYFTTDLPFTTTVEADAFAFRTIFYLGALAILFAFHLQLCDEFALREVNALENILELQYASYRQSQDAIDMVNQKFHDLKHQLALFRSELGGEEKRACLEQIERDIQAYESQFQTGNQVLDAVLTQKASLCFRQGITLTAMADGAPLAFLEVMDLSALLGNALDNAMEAVLQIPEPEERLIRLNVERWKGCLRIRVENRCTQEVVLQGDLPRTTKKDQTRHGYGLKSIRATAEKYGGTMTVQVRDGWFTLGVLIPLPTEKEAAGAEEGQGQSQSLHQGR